MTYRREQTAVAVPAANRKDARAEPGYWKLRLRDARAFIGRQPPSFWLVNLYLFLEYVRPQEIYDSLKGKPFSLAVMVLATVAYVLEGARTRKMNLVDGGLIAYTLLILLSSVLAWSPAESSDGLKLWFGWMLAYFLITAAVDTEERFIVFMLLYFLWNMKMSQHGTRSWASAGFGFKRFGVTGAPGWFRNSGEFGIEMVVFFPVSFYFVLALRSHWSKWKLALMSVMPLSALVSIQGSSSRGAQVALGAVVATMLLKSRYKFRALIGGLLVAGFAFMLLPAEQKTRFTEAGDDQTSQLRLQYWRDGTRIFEEHPVTGIGYSNWLQYYQANYDADGQLPHNIFVQAGSELGVPGIVLFVFLIGATWAVNRRTRRLAARLGKSGVLAREMAHGLDCALVGYLVGGFFVSVLYYPFFWMNLAFSVALHNATAVKLRRVEREERRRAGLPAQAGVGAVAPGSTLALGHGA